MVRKKDGWASARSLQKETGSRDVTIKNFAEKFRTEHPEWFEIQKTPSLVSEHYHPELAAIIKNHFAPSKRLY